MPNPSRPRRRWRGARGLAAASVVAAGAALAPSALAATGDPVLINEVLASHTGTDDTGYVELFGTPGTVLDGLSLIVVEGDAGASQGAIDRRIDFGPGDVIGSNGFFLVGNPAGLSANYGVTPNLTVANNFLENSSETIALVETSSIAGATVGGGEVVRDSIALTDGDAGDVAFFGAPELGPDGPFFLAGARRVTDGVDTDAAADWVFADFGLGAANTPTGGDTPPPPPPPLVKIHEIQGPGATSPIVGETVEIRGVVTGIDDEVGASFTRTFPEDRGIFVQEERGDEDGDPRTSEGIYVGFVDADEYTPGQQVKVVGTVKEKFGLTMLAEVIGEEPEVIGTAPLPRPKVLRPRAARNQDPVAREYYERLEGMRVRARLATANSGGTNKFGELFLTLGPRKSRVFRDSVRPDLFATDADAGAGNPVNPRKPDTASTTLVRADLFDRAYNVVGPFTYSFSNYKVMVQPQRRPRVLDTGVRFPYRGITRPRHHETNIASYNLENFFPVGGELDLGTVSEEEYREKRNRLASGIRKLLKRPHVVAVQEVVNEEILDDLGDRIGGYEGYLEEGNDNRGIDVGFLVRRGVRVLDVRQLGKTAPNPTTATCSDVDGLLFDRPPLAIEVKRHHTAFWVVNNHFSSKSAPDACRVAQAEFVRDWVEGIEDRGGEVMVTGDLNAFEDETPLAALEDGTTSLENLWDEVPAGLAYSFQFSGRLQTLDHTLVTDGLESRVKRFRYAPISNDYYERDRRPRDGHSASDHDAPAVTLRTFGRDR